jgi:hypothetical protein
VITVTDCREDTSVIDGAAVLQQSILKSQHQQTYNFVALVYEYGNNLSRCTEALKRLGYLIQIKGLSFQKEELRSGRAIYRGKGCCGIAEYIKLYAFNMTEYDVVIHLDVDVIVFQSLDPLVRILVDQDLRWVSSIRNIPLNQTRPDQVDFLFVREYKTFNRARPYNPRKNGVQGAFFAVRPSHERFEDLLAVLQNATFVRNEAGWGEDNFGDYWGAAQIQGFLSYYYYRFSLSGIELDHCRYNTLGQDIRYLPKTNGSCRTGGAVCEDCSVIPMREVVLGHLSRCLKPWCVGDTSVLCGLCISSVPIVNEVNTATTKQVVQENCVPSRNACLW